MDEIPDEIFKTLSQACETQFNWQGKLKQLWKLHFEDGLKTLTEAEFGKWGWIPKMIGLVFLFIFTLGHFRNYDLSIKKLFLLK